ncbi:MAG: MaoC/PaaZ C-terminal domain-containing protein [Anaerolineae bacterium]|nr:MaoC/PaaZ C-terminal domain-containing protein [Anaerolineae bacterium]
MTSPTDQSLTRGRYFEEFAVGFSAATAARTITETDVVNFAALTGDWNPLHTDAEFAKTTVFGQRIAHGLLILSIASGLITRLGLIEGTAEAFRELSWKFRAPVFIGDTIHATATVSETRPLPRLGSGMVILEVSVINQRGEVVQKGTWQALVKSRPA